MEIINTLGRRKNAVARAYLTPGSGKFIINGKEMNQYFGALTLQYQALLPFETTSTKDQFDVKINVIGGGSAGQAGAIRHALARALCEVNEEYRPALKLAGLMTRDNRMVERKKPGQKKARKRFQFSKR